MLCPNVLKLACENAVKFLNDKVKYFLSHIKPLVCLKMYSKNFGNLKIKKIMPKNKFE